MSQSDEDQLRNMATNLISMIRNARGTAVQGQSSAGATSRGHQAHREASSTQQNMARCFPGLFKGKNGKVGKRPGVKKNPIPFFLLNKPMERTPKLSEELALLQAGLGKKTIQIPDDANHKEISEILVESYPKINNLEGGWLIHKAMGGAGQRRLNLITPEEEGYMGSSLVKAWGGRGCLYIMPIQHVLDTTPLPFTAKEFQSMPKAKCVNCMDYIPLQLLSVHVETCSNIPETTDDIIQVEDDEIVNDVAVDSDIVASSSPEESFDIPVNTKDSSASVSCPLCWQDFTEDDIHLHASRCQGNRDKLDSPTTTPYLGSLSDILKSLDERVDRSKTFQLNITREGLFERGLKQWKRQKQASPKNPLRVSFIGEQGIDDGALRREFLTEMIKGLEDKLFEGDAKGKNPKYSITAYQDDLFKVCGEVMAVSVVQGGPAPNFLSPWSYHFLSYGQIKQTEDYVTEVTDGEIRTLIKQVEEADEDNLLLLSGAIVACGYTGKLGSDSKKNIIDAISLHSLTRLTPMLSQIRKGLALYGVDEILQSHSNTLQPLFIPGNLKEVDSDWMLKTLRPNLSAEGSVRRQKEIKIINYLQDFLQDLEDQEVVEGSPSDEVNKPVSVESFFQWISGQAHVPLIESERETFKITVNFEHDCVSRYGAHTICYPIVNACAVSITLPAQHLTTYSEFKENLTQAVLGGCEFSRH